MYSWGCNDDGALGRKTRKHTEDEMVPGAVEGLEEIKVVRIAAGDSVSVALSESGNVYAWGTFRVPFLSSASSDPYLTRGNMNQKCW